MRDVLAEKVLARVVDWDAERLARELLDLALLAEFKYDEYGQFSPGMRFIESLSLWLGQFEGDEQEAMYSLVRNCLVFVSDAEMQHYIKTAYADHAKPILVREAARRADIREDRIARVAGSREFSDLRKKCLYLGLSDGSRMGDFRRFSGLGHDQVHSLYEIAGPRRNRMLQKLSKLLGPGSGNAKFEIVFLIDDFSASGLSYLHEKGGRFEGKIMEFVEQFGGAGAEGRMGLSRTGGGGLGDMFAPDPLVVVLLYTATDRAVAHIKRHASKMLEERGVRLEVVVVHEICAGAASAEPGMGAVEPILAANLDSSALPEGYWKGRHQRPHLGFDECGMLVVLSHNCPNNTLPIVWHESEGDPRARALFPRRERLGGV